MGALRRRSVLVGGAAMALAAALPRPAIAAPDDLRMIADGKDLRFGTAIDPELLVRPDYVKLLVAQCNTIVPRNSLKWNATERTPGKFDFGVPDKVISFADQHQLAVRGTTLVWYRSPGWVTRLEDPKSVSDAITKHITTVMTRYAGKIGSWDVVNEPFEYDAPKLRRSVFQDKLGEQYMDLAFHTARSADPHCQLVLNETHLYEVGDVYSAKRDQVLALLDRLLARKVPIDAVGVQGHLRPGLDKIDSKAFGTFCGELKSRGLAVLITELDASCRFIKRMPGFTAADYGPLFAELVTVAGAHGKLSAVITWGLSPYGLPPNEDKNPDPTCKYRVNLFDGDLKPEPTFAATRDALMALAS